MKGNRRIDSEFIELYIPVDKVIDWSAGLRYIPPKYMSEKLRKVK